MLPVAAFTWTEAAGLILAALSAISAKLRTERNPAADVTLMVRRPRLWAARHPYRALCRRLHSR
jgi:hypothetical protein